MLANLNFNLQVLLDSIGLVQGVTLGILLIVLNKRKYRSTFFLGLFLLFFSLELATWISTNLQISDNYPEIFLLPFNFSWLLFPLFFIYTQQVSIFSDEKTKYWLLYPGILSILAQIFIFWLPIETKIEIEASSWHKLVFWMLGNYYSWIIGIWNLWILYKHRIEVQNTFSYLAFKELQWARYFLIYLLVTSVYGHLIAYGFPDLYKDNTVFSVMDLVAIYWVSYFGITQRNVLKVLFKNDIINDDIGKLKDAGQPYSTAPEKLSELMERINGYMITAKAFVNPELSIVDLAEGLEVHPKLVSTTINTVSNQNFNSYVNGFRIEKALKLLEHGDLEAYSMEGIGNEVGFKSKSAFYAAFKKETGTTPTRYRTKNSA